MNIFIYPDIFSQFDNGSIAANVDLIEDYELITSSFNSSTDPYENFGLISVTSTPATEQITLDSNPPSVLNYRTGNVDTSEDYGSLRYGLTDPFSIESYGLITSPVDEFESYDLISTPIYSYGTTSKTITYGLDSILYLESPESFGLITENPYIQYGFLTDSVTYTDYGSVADSLPANQYTDYGNNNLLASDEDYGLVQDPYNEYTDYHFVFYSETVYPYGTFTISGSGAESFTPQTATGSGSISASGVKGEAITDFYGIDAVAIDTSLEFSTSYGSVADPVDESEDYGLITSTANDVDSYGFLYPVITPFGLFNISGSATNVKFKQVFSGSGSVIESGVLKEENTDRYTIDSILLGGSPENYGSVGSAATTSESYGLITSPIDQAEDYDYIFYPAGETVYPYGTFRISGASFDEIRSQFTHEGSGSISASGVKGEAITKFYGIDSDSIDTSIEFSTSYGLVSDSIDETEDYGLITLTADEVDSYGFLYPVITPFGLFNVSGSASERFKPATYRGSGSIIESGILKEENTDRYTIDSILPGGSPENYGSVANATDEPSESYGLIIAPIDQIEDYHYIFYPAGETITPYGTLRISGASFDELRIQFLFDGSGSISASGVKGEAITKFYGIDSDSIDTNIEFSTSYGSIADSIDETEDYGLITSTANEVDIYGFLYPRVIPFGLFNVSGSAGERFKPATYRGSGSIDNTGILEEKNTDRYSIDSILPGGSPEDYGSVGSASTSSESYGLITAPIDQVEDYHYIFYAAGETITPYGTIRISGASFNELRIKFIHEGSGSISASGVKGEAITKFYGIDSDSIDTSIEFSTSYGLVSDSIDESEDYGLITSTADEVDSYGFLYPVITPFGLFDISGSAGERFKPATYRGSGSIIESGILEEKNTDSYNLGSILPGSTSENYGSVANATDEPSESYGLITAPIDQVEDYHYIFYAAGETITPYGTIRISGASFNELRIKFIHEGSGSISASGVKGEAITKFYNIDSTLIDTSIEFSTSYGSVADSVDETEDYGLITSIVTEVDSYGFLYPVITPFGLFNVSGSAGERFKPATYLGSGSIINDGILEEKNTDRYTIDSILLGGSPENYGSVGSAATTSESYGLITSPIDQVEDYHYIFYPAGETITPYGTIQISGSAITELAIQFIHEGSGSISASGVKGEAITDSYNLDSVQVDTSIEFSTSYGLIANSVDETEDYGLITSTANEVDSYGFLYPVITPFGLFEISGSAGERFKPATYLGSGSIIESGILEEKNTDSYNLESILLGGSPENYGFVGSAATTSESYGLITAPIDQVEDYDYIFYTAGEDVYPYGTLQISGSAITELRIKFIHEGSGSISASGVKGEAITDFYGIDAVAIDTSLEFSTSYGLIVDSVDETEDYGLITSVVTDVDSYGFLYPVITPFGLFNVSGSASAVFKNGAYIGSGSIIESGILEEENTDSYNLGSILLGGSPENYGSVDTSATSSEDYEFITAPIDQAEDYHYIFYPAGETVYPYGTLQISGNAVTELAIQFIHEGSGSIAANGVAGEAITKFYSVDSIEVDTSIEFSTSYGSVADSIDESEDYGLITSTANEVDSYGFLYPVITPFGLFEISGSASAIFKNGTYIGSGSIIESGILEEKNTDRYTIDSILLGGSPENYGSIANATDEPSENYEFITSSIDQVEDYDYIFYTAGEDVYPFGTIQISGSAITELAIQFIHEGSGSISASGVKGEAITKFYNIDSTEVDTSIEFSTSYGSVADSIDESEDYGLIASIVTEVDSYGFLYPVITPFGLFNVSGSAGERFNPSSYIGSGSIDNAGILEEKNTDRYTIDSILLGGSPENYGSVDTSATTSEDYELIASPIDQAEDYYYIFYPAGETVYPFGTIQISGDAKTELAIQFIHEGSGSIAANGVAGEAITKFYGIDSDSIDTNIEFSTSYGSVADSVDETEDYGLITSTADEVDSYGFLYPVITPFGLFNVSGSASAVFKNGAYIGSGSITNDGILEEKNTDSYNLGSILSGGSPENYGSVADATDEPSESYGIITAPIDQAEDYYYIFYPAGETVYPFGTIQISGDAKTELAIQFIHEGSGSIAANGVAGEAITKFYSVDSIEVDTNIEFSTSYGSIADSIDETEDYGLITSIVTEVDSYGFLYPVITPFGLFNVSGSARESFKPAFVGSGSIVNDGVLEEKNTDSYNLGSILPGGSPENYGSIADATDEPSESYGIIDAPIDQAEDYHYIFYPAGETITPYGTIRISGNAVTELAIQFIHEGSGSIAANGVAGEAITKFYSVDSIEVDTSIEFSTSYGSVADSIDESEDYGLITSTANEVDSYGFLYPVITPFGLFNVSGSASAVFKNGTYIGSGSIIESGVLREKNTDSYNLGSILPGGSPENYGSIADATDEPSESYGLVTAPIDQSEDYHYIFYPAGETITPYGTIRISGDVGKRQRFAYSGSGTINIIGYALVPQRYEGSGSFSSFGGAAEVKGSNPPDQTVPIVISGAATNLKNTFSNVGSGTIVISGDSTNEFRGEATYTASGTIEISGTAAESFVPATAIGSGTLFGIGGAAEVSGSNPPDQTVPIVISGAATDLKNTFSNVGSGSFSSFGGAAEVSGSNPPDQITPIVISGSVAESFIPATAIGSGSFSSFGGAAEVSGSNPPDQTVPIVISGAATNLKNTFSNVGSGTIVISGNSKDEFRGLSIYSAVGTIEISGTAAESFVPTTYIGSGSANIEGTKIEKNTDSYNLNSIGYTPESSYEDLGILSDAVVYDDYGSVLEYVAPSQYEENGPTLLILILPYGTFSISGAATNLKNTFSNVGSGTGVFSGSATDLKNTYSNAGSGTGVFSGTAAESFVPATAIGSGTLFAIGGGAEVSGSNPPDQTVPIVISGAATNLKNTFSNVGSGSFSSFGGAAEVKGSNPPDQTVPIVISGTKVEKRRISEVGSGFFSSFGGGADVKGSNPPDQTLVITLSGNARERFIPATAIGSGSISESGAATDLKNTRSEVGIGTVAITGGITPDVQIYVPYWTGSGTLFGIGGAAEVSGSNPPDRFVLFTISGNAAESFTPATAIGSGIINITGVGIGISNPYKAPFVYVTII